MKYTVFIFALIAFCSLTGLGQAAKTVSKPITSVTIDVSGKPTLKMTAADFAKYPRTVIKAIDHDGTEATFSGIELRTILAAAGAKLGKDLKGPTIGQYLIVEAADGYRAVYSLTDLDPDFTEKVVIIADRKNNKPLDAKNGPWQVVSTAEKKHARWVRQITALRVRLAN